MPLISLEDDEDQRWVPTHVNVTVLRARGLRIKGKQSSRYVYTVIQLRKEKYITGLAEKAAEPEWNEECSLELQPGLLECVSAHAPGSSHLTLTVMLRVLIGLDMFLGEAVVPLDKIFQDGTCPKNHWIKLHSKAGRKEKERGELQVTVQFTRNNMTASMYDLTIKDKPRSAFGKLKDRVRGKKRGDVESSSAILPGRYAALSSSTSQSVQEDRAGEELRQEECGDERKSKVKDFFLKGKLQKNSDTQSCSSLASESSNPSSTGDPFVPIELCSTPIYSSRIIEPFRADSDGGVKVISDPKVMTHKRAYSDEASKITAAMRPSPIVENLKGQNTVLSKSTLCINGSHIYSDPINTKGPGTLPIKRTLLEKCSPLSRSLQNLTRRTEDTQRRYSIDKSRKESDGEAENSTSQRASMPEEKPVHATAPLMTNTTTTEVTDKGKKLRKTLFSSGRSDSLPAKTEQGHESRLRGWFGSSDTQNKPRLGVPSKVESSPDTSSSLPSYFPKSPPRSLPLLSETGQISSCNSGYHANPFTHPSPTPPSISPTNPFLLRLQRNPFFEELIAEEALKSPPANFSHPSSSFGHYFASPVRPGLSRSAHVGPPNKVSSIKRERPRSVARQRSLPAFMPGEPETVAVNSYAVQDSANFPLSDSRREKDEFEVFATNRLKSPVGTPTRPSSAPIAPLLPNYNSVDYRTVKPKTGNSEGFPKHSDLPAVPPRKPTRTPMASRERYSDGWLDRAQELAVQKEACVLLETDLASLRHVRETNSHVSHLGKESPTYLHFGALEQNKNESTPSNAVQMLRDENLNILGTDKETILNQRGLGCNLIGSYGNVLVERLPENGTLKSPICLYERMQENSQHSKSNHTVPSTPFCLSDCDTTVSESLCSDFQIPVNPDSSFKGNSKPNHTNNQDSNNNNTEDTSQFAYIDCDSSPSDSKIQSNLVKIDKASNKASIQEHDALGIPAHLLNRITTDLKLCSPKETPDIVAHKDMLSQGTHNISDMKDFEGKPSDVPPHSTLIVKTENKEGSMTLQTYSLPNCGDISMTALLKPEATKDNAGLDVPCEVEGHMINNEFETTTAKLKAEHHKVPISESSKINESLSTPVNDISFEDLHARVAPRGSGSPSQTEVRSAGIRTHSATNSPKTDLKKGLFRASSDAAFANPPSHQLLHNPASPYPSNTIFDFNLSSLMHPPTISPDLGSTLAEASNTNSTAQLPATTQHTLPPDKADPPSSLLPPESSPHPVKPLTNSAVSGEKKSVLEKLRSSIHPGRSTQQNVAEPEKSQVCMSDAYAHYQSLSNMELIALLLRQEMDVERQRAESELQATLLEKREAELKKLKVQVRDLEDYIDKLLVRIMEQTPTLLQVRARPK